MMRVAVIGAGPAGITAAYQLAKAGVEVEVFEATGAVGGLARSYTLWDQTVDLGPHRFFSSDARVNRLWLEVVGRDYQMIDRMTRIYYQGQFFNYPLAAGNALEEPRPARGRPLPGQLRRGSAPPRAPPTTAASKTGSCAALAADCLRFSSRPTAKSCGASRAASSTPTSPPSGSRSCRSARR